MALIFVIAITYFHIFGPYTTGKLQLKKIE